MVRRVPQRAPIEPRMAAVEPTDARIEDLRTRLEALARASGAAPEEDLAPPPVATARPPVQWLVCGLGGVGKTRLIQALLGPGAALPQPEQAGAVTVLRIRSAATRPGTAAGAEDPSLPDGLPEPLQVSLAHPLLDRGLQIIEATIAMPGSAPAADTLPRWSAAAGRVLFVVGSEAAIGVHELRALMRLQAPAAALAFLQTHLDQLAEGEPDLLRTGNLAILSAALGLPAAAIPYLPLNTPLKELADRARGDAARQARLLAQSGFDRLLDLAEADLRTADIAHQQQMARAAALAVQQGSRRLRSRLASRIAVAQQPGTEATALRDLLPVLLDEMAIWRSRQRAAFLQDWRARFRALATEIDGRIVAGIDAREHGTIVKPIISSLRDDKRDAYALEAETPVIGERCLADCDARLRPIAAAFAEQAARLTEELAVQYRLGVNLDLDALLLAPIGQRAAIPAAVRKSVLTQLGQVISSGDSWANSTNRLMEMIGLAGVLGVAGLGLPVAGGVIGGIVKYLGLKRDEREQALAKVGTELARLIEQVRDHAIRHFARIERDATAEIETALTLYFDEMEYALKCCGRDAAPGEGSAALPGQEILPRLYRELAELDALDREAAAIAAQAVMETMAP
jgi:hypothetical protein